MERNFIQKAILRHLSHSIFLKLQILFRYMLVSKLAQLKDLVVKSHRTGQTF